SRNTLQPGQRTEAYFVIRNIQPNEQANDSMRPKLAE
ncbi:TPA: TraK protein, partial [Citrobacter freundii]|nr:TraK protein [Citrobacter freundii]